jgi:hypothetical protein
MVESMGLWVDRVLEGEVDGVAVEHSRDEILSIRSFVKAAGSLEVNECFGGLLAHCARISDIASRRCDLEARVVGDEEESGQNSDLDQTLGALVREFAMARKTKLNLVDLMAGELRRPPQEDQKPSDLDRPDQSARMHSLTPRVNANSRVLESDRQELG